ELGVVLSVVHFNHQLRGAESDADESFVAELARHHKLQFHRSRGDVRALAADKHLSIEAAARRMRYECFRELLASRTENRIATAHTLDDQAETVLLRIVRGAGTRGLAGIYPVVNINCSGQHSAVSIQPDRATSAYIIRPLLGIERKELHRYLTALGQSWREDPSNRDLRHARNRVRHGILPRLERNLNPAVRQALSEVAELARGEEDYWAERVREILPQLWDSTSKSLCLTRSRASIAESRGVLREFPLAVQRRIVRAAAESLGIPLEFRHVEEVLEIVASEAESPKAAALPDGWSVTREKGVLRFDQSQCKDRDYEYPLRARSYVDIPELAVRIEVLSVSPHSQRGYNPEQLLCSAVLGKKLSIRNWRPGDRFWPAHTKAPKKIKELLAERHITGAEKKNWPVMVCDGEIVWVRGFARPAHLAASEHDEQAILVREIPIRSE